MTVGELRKALEVLPDDMPVKLAETPYATGEAPDAELAEVFYPDGEPCLLIS